MSPNLEIAVRVGGSAAVFTAMALWEWLAPRRHFERRAGAALAGQSRHSGDRYCGGAALGADRSSRGGDHRYGEGLGAIPGARSAVVGGVRARRDSSRSGDLHPTCGVASRAGAVAAAPHASRRHRHRCDHRRALSSAGNIVVAGDQNGGGGRARRAGGRRLDLRGAAQRHVHVQPQQCRRCRPASNRLRAGSW